MKKLILHIAFWLIILVMILPAMQMQFRIIKEKPLNGAFSLSEKPAFTRAKWMSGEFQAGFEKYLKDNSGFRSFLVRLQNQVDFSFFRKANAEGATVGKHRQLYEYDYIRSWLAFDYPGDKFVETKLQRLKYVQKYLKQHKGIDLVLVFEPGKASFYPEYIPEHYRKKKTGASTYERYREKAEEYHVDFIDLHSYFMQLKAESPYPLFPRYGTHWSVYGMQFAADSLLRFIENRRGIDLRNVTAEGIKTSTEPFDTDDDVLKTMNLLLPLKGEELAYPQLSFDTVSPAYEPMVLVVADSYYWNIFNTGIPEKLFANQAFWYFNSLVYPDHYVKPSYTKDLDLQKEIEKQEVIFLMITERFVHKFDWRFIDQIYNLYTPDNIVDPVYDKINDIMQVASWYNGLIDKAALKGTSLESVLEDEGKYLFRKEDRLKYMAYYGAEHFMNIISEDPGWMEYIRKKAKERNITEDEMLKTDGLYIFKKDEPGLFDLNQGINSTIKLISGDPLLLDSLTEEASDYCIRPDDYIRMKAWDIYKENEIKKTINAISSDPDWKKEVERKAQEKNIAFEEMSRIDAEYMWNEKIRQLTVN